MLNSNAKWNNSIDEAFEDLYTILSQLGVYNDMKQELDAYAQGLSNMSYLYINEDTGKILSNDSDLVKELDYKKSSGVSITASGTQASTDSKNINSAESQNSTASKSISSAIDYYQNLHEILDSREEVSYILIQTKPEEFTSNLKGLDIRDTFPGNDITADSWKESLHNALLEETGNYIFAAYVNQKLPVSDVFSSGKTFFDSYSSYTRPVFWIGILCLLLFVASFVFLTAIAGRKSTDEELHLCFFDRWPTELAAGLVVIAWLPVIVFGLTHLPIASYQIARLQSSLIDAYFLFRLTLFGLYTLFWFQIGYLSLVRRIKAKQLWKNSILRRLLLLIVKIIKKAAHKIRVLADFYARNTAARLKVTFAFLVFVFLKYFICAVFLDSGLLFFGFSFLVDLLILGLGITKAYHQEQILKV